MQKRGMVTQTTREESHHRTVDGDYKHHSKTKHRHRRRGAYTPMNSWIQTHFPNRVPAKTRRGAPNGRLHSRLARAITFRWQQLCMCEYVSVHVCVRVGNSFCGLYRGTCSGGGRNAARNMTTHDHSTPRQPCVGLTAGELPQLNRWRSLTAFKCACESQQCMNPTKI